MVIERPFLGTTSFGHRPPVGRLAVGQDRKCLGREPDGAKVGQQVSGEGPKVAHAARI